jgi:hypothetical protein
LRVPLKCASTGTPDFFRVKLTVPFPRYDL